MTDFASCSISNGIATITLDDGKATESQGGNGAVLEDAAVDEAENESNSSEVEADTKGVSDEDGTGDDDDGEEDVATMTMPKNNEKAMWQRFENSQKRLENGSQNVPNIVS